MSELDRAWAVTQVEAMVDGSLSPEAAQRMRVLMQQDPILRRQVGQAISLRRDLARLARRPAPAGLWRRLWKIPSADRPFPILLPVATMAGIAAVALAVSVFNRPSPEVEALAQRAAYQDLVVAMAYLQKGMLVATDQVNENVGTGMMDAYVMSRDAITRGSDRISGSSREGVQDDD